MKLIREDGTTFSGDISFLDHDIIYLYPILGSTLLINYTHTIAYDWILEKVVKFKKLTNGYKLTTINKNGSNVKYLLVE